MIYITGDTHGDFSRFNTKNFPEQKNMTKDDFVIVCGDFGGVWDGSKEERYWLDWLNGKPFTTLFVDGNHENFDMLGRMPEACWNGGKVHFVRDGILHLMRGQVFNIDGRTFFAMGGASSHDIDGGVLETGDPDYDIKRRRLDRQGVSYRVNHVSWWKEELPSAGEYETALKNLDAAGFKVDYVLSHCCPSGIADIIGRGLYRHDELTDFMETIKERCDFKYWFCGHYHENRIAARKFVPLYKRIMDIGENFL